MYILQELCYDRFDNPLWLDKSKSDDYDFILQLYKGYSDKFLSKKFRIIEVFYYV